jgi:DnaJ-class molecular chaperone
MDNSIRARLQRFSDSELTQELETRKKERERLAEELRKEKEVRVICPECNGSGTRLVRDPFSGMEDPATCLTCNGLRTIIAIKA